MKLNIGERQTISVCKRDRRSTWPGAGTNDKRPRNTDKGMKMVVVIEKDAKGRKVSRTVFEKA